MYYKLSVGMLVYADLHRKSKAHKLTGYWPVYKWAELDLKTNVPISGLVPVSRTRRCAVCGKPTPSGYMFDERTCLCSGECATKFFDNDKGCVEILVDEGKRLIWHDQFPEVTHYRVNVNHHSAECFKHFDNEAKMFDWISEKTGANIRTFEEAEKWGDKHNYCEILYLNVRDYYENRREYVLKLRECEDIMSKAQRTRNDKKLKRLLRDYSFAYDDANWYWGAYPEVWQGEI